MVFSSCISLNAISFFSLNQCEIPVEINHRKANKDVLMSMPFSEVLRFLVKNSGAALIFQGSQVSHF